MKMFKKSLSVFLTVVMLMSVCACLFTTSVGAYTVKDKANVQTLLELDFDDGTGVADVRASHDSGAGVWSTSFVDDGEGGKYVYMTNKSYQGYSAMLGNPGSEMTVSSTTAQHPDRFQLPAAGTYTLTFDWKVFAGTSILGDSGDTKVGFSFYKALYAAVGVSKSGIGTIYYEPVEGEYEIVETTDKNGDPFTAKKITKDSEWMTKTITVKLSQEEFDLGKNGICFSTSAGNLAKNIDDHAIAMIGIDNVVVKSVANDLTTGVAGTTYVYDFKDAEGNLMKPYEAGKTLADDNVFGSSDSAAADGCHAWFSNSDSGKADTTQSFFTENGAMFVSTTGGVAVEATGTSAGSWAHKLYLKDPDFRVGNSDYGFLKMEAGHYYHVEAYVKSYSGKAVDGTTDLANTANFKASIVISKTTGGASGSEIGRVAVATLDYTKTDATVISATIDGDDTSWSVGAGTNVGRFIGIAADTNRYLLVEKVVVTVYDKSAFSYSENESFVTFDNGLNDIYLPNGEGLGIGPVAVVDDPTDKGHGKVLEYRHTGISSTLTLGLAAGAGSGCYSNTTPMASAAKGFEAKAGHKYRITMDTYVSQVTGKAGSHGVYLASKGGICVAGNKTAMTVSNALNYTGTTQTNGAGNGSWVPVILEFVATQTAIDKGHTNVCISLGVTENDGLVYYFDNIKIVDITDSAGTSAANVKRSIRAAQNGLEYVSAGLRFRGEIATSVVSDADGVGFIVAPEAHVNAYTGTDAWYTITNGKAALASAKVANATNTVYGTNGDNTQYQMILTKLTQYGETKNLLDTQFVVKMYTVKDGVYTYYDVATASYNQVKAAYAEKDAFNASKY